MVVCGSMASLRQYITYTIIWHHNTVTELESAPMRLDPTSVDQTRKGLNEPTGRTWTLQREPSSP